MPLENEIAILVDFCRRALGDENAERVARAARLAVRFHEGQVRKLDGSPYVTHCLEVATECLERGLLDVDAIAASLLHDSLEDAPASMDAGGEIERALGPAVLEMVLALSKIRNLQTGTGDIPATYRRILGAAAKDLRVLIIKIFDVLHNASTLGVHGPAKAKVKASLGLIYVGVARRLGMMDVADRLIEHFLPHLMPVQYQRAMKNLTTLQKQGAAGMNRLLKVLEVVLHDDLARDFSLESKKIADFFYLTEKPGTGRLQRVGWPVFRLRLFVDDDDKAWRVLGKMHTLFGPLPRHIRDYLNAPRINGFRALTSRVFWEGQPFTVQVVRSQDHATNRRGVLAQWGKSGPDMAPYMRLLATLGDSDLRMSEVHAHVLPDLLDVYTPRGDRLTFPVGSVVVDFAYLVHTELGERCVGAKVNGIVRPPDHPLGDGDVVRVLTAKEARPQRAWLDVVKTARARTLIKQALKNRDIPVDGIKRTLSGNFLLTTLSGPDILWSTCCMAVPGDAIIGRLSGDGRWIVHRADCAKAQGSQWLPGAWAHTTRSEILQVTFIIHHRTGSLLPVLELLAKRGVNGHSIQGQGRSADSYIIAMELESPDHPTLGTVLKELATVSSVQEIRSYCWKQ
ncbi:MAG: bifunctional (p)ppGpp synthetase/guanosine-3',5'-bis(diphosphate) 3'-pyrophosphohydrolase [Magnetococcales bacterium]|nr:bifunctional (p)ppGpp synthetase/guanosine-3',5'-bis(diphosphate) 3'-pyrophosphohydrolase [Magnetococcales bacterium]MBF0155772.1 bifunctional (p)ppGpp synthetase/guanosine-3',5'-bis(diphosphate) 3'-pyrophosphohydrolase [Magnetococcales bacterium]